MKTGSWWLLKTFQSVISYQKLTTIQSVSHSLHKNKVLRLIFSHSALEQSNVLICWAEVESSAVGRWRFPGQDGKIWQCERCSVGDRSPGSQHLTERHVTHIAHTNRMVAGSGGRGRGRVGDVGSLGAWLGAWLLVLSVTLVAANSPPRFLLETNVGSEIVLRLREGPQQNNSILRSVLVL